MDSDQTSNPIFARSSDWTAIWTSNQSPILLKVRWNIKETYCQTEKYGLTWGDDWWFRADKLRLRCGSLRDRSESYMVNWSLFWGSDGSPNGFGKFDTINGIWTEYDRSPIGFLKSDPDLNSKLIPRSWRFIGSSSDSDQVHLGLRPNSRRSSDERRSPIRLHQYFSDCNQTMLDTWHVI